MNALARQLVEVLVPNLPKTITTTHVHQAKEILIQRQDTHIDSLASLLQEDRVRAIIGPMLTGQALDNVPPDDLQFLIDWGLCHMEFQGGLMVSNPICQEVLPRVLSQTPKPHCLRSPPLAQPPWHPQPG